MPDKTLSVATYAAGASLAAITLIYVFGPTYLLDNEKGGSSSSRKKGVVGLSNTANDCFINSILQALAGLGDLRLYLIRETHRRSLDDAWVYAQPVPTDADLAEASATGPSGATESPPRPQPGVGGKPIPEWKLVGLQSGIVTQGLKRVLDQLNERPIYRKTASAMPFVRDLETAFRQRISRQQQDAQEFLQVVAERLCDEYHAGQRARRHARQRPISRAAASPEHSPAAVNGAGADHEASEGGAKVEADDGGEDRDEDEEEDGFPLEGRFASQIECLTCGFKPHPTEAAFCTLTLHVPQASSTTLNACFDGMFKTEYIDDFKCERCRLVHARDTITAELARARPETAESSSSAASSAAAAGLAAKRRTIAALERALETDPERYQDPEGGAALPDARHAPKRRIARHIRMTRFPKILAVHLSRSSYDAGQSLKNSAKVAFPERLPLGGLLHRCNYKLLGVVTHKGSHNSGHYESFRRQNVYPPFSTPNAFQLKGAYSRSVGAGSPVATPRIKALQRADGRGSPSASASSLENSPLASTQDLRLPSSAGSPTSSPSADSKSPVPSGGSGSSTPSSSSRSLPPPQAQGQSQSQPSQQPSPPLKVKKERDSDLSSLRSVARSTLSKITSSSRSGSRSRSRGGQVAGVVADDGAAGESQPSPDGNTAPPNPDQTKSLKPKPTAAAKHKRKKGNELWWRLSDEKVKEASTKDVLAMQREVYLLFYEMDKDEAYSL